ncbi:chitin deacetylase [Actinomortierella ambigua]|uniref:chitin deacetylase n=1 Tax=Actinomortierella ambigua TaxID=1343610 RepID=A0A9P6UCW3_9FUNG|nr:chitin deacetylase [Actinomortierella ambigua]
MIFRIPTALATLSVSLLLVSAHPGNGCSLYKRQTATCPATYAPVAEGSYPALDCVPFVEDPQVQEWLKLVNFTQVPTTAVSNAGACPPDISTIPASQCWWTCQKCVAPTDIVNCPTPMTWGLTYDDGPSPDSPRLYDYLKTHNQTTTLFIVGSRAISYPDTLKRAYQEGHQIAIHTWSHPSMTGLTNEQVVAELKWTEKAIHDILGVTPTYWRPPYGDVDDRVRAIATQLGYKTVIWTQGFDTNDWDIPGGLATPESVVANFQSLLAEAPTMSTGFIVLEHDLYPQEVDVAINSILPMAYNTTGLTIEPVAKCIGDFAPYKEGAGTFQNEGGNGTTNSTLAQTYSGASAQQESSSRLAMVALTTSCLMVLSGLLL